VESSTMVVDTGIFIEYLRAKNKENTLLFHLPENSKIYISSVTLYELYIGATTPDKWNDIDLLTSYIPVLPFNKEIAISSGEIYQSLRKSNKIIEFRDIFIAATALANNLPLLTFNEKHFSRISDLSLVDKTQLI